MRSMMLLELSIFLLILSPMVSHADIVTFSGTVSYNGAYSADTLYVAVIDTTEGNLPPHAIQSIAIPAGPPFNLPYLLEFDNSGVPPLLFVFAHYDVDGGGSDSASPLDLLGWYSGQPLPEGIATGLSQSGLDFPLPTGEIHGYASLCPFQTSTTIHAGTGRTCLPFEARPGLLLTESGEWGLIGLYPGDWCLYAWVTYDGWPTQRMCYQYECSYPNLIHLAEGEIKTGIYWHFGLVDPVLKGTWGSVKTRFR